MKEYVHDLHSSLKGAIVHPTQDCRLRMLCHRVSPEKSSPVLGWEKLDHKAKDHRTCEQELKHGMSCYTMISAMDNSEYEIYVPTHLDGKAFEVFTSLDRKSKRPGFVRMSERKNAKGEYYTKLDASGMFVPCAHALQCAYPGSVIKPFANVDNVAIDGGKHKDKETHANFLNAISEFKGQFDFFAYCGHGVKEGLASPHIGAGNGMDELVTVLKRILKPNATIIFYACNTGLPEGFAQKIGKKFQDCKVFAHWTAGPGDVNPHKVRILNGQPPETLETLLGEEDFQKWAKYLKHSDLFLRYWRMSIGQLKAEVNGQHQKAAA